MDPSMSGFEKRLVYRSLSCLIHVMKDRITTVDLRNETSLTGKIVNIDAQMNITMEDAAFVEFGSSYKYFSQCHIPSRMIRDVIIPDDIRITAAIAEMCTPKGRSLPDKKGRTFKMKRAMLQQQETLRLINESKERAGAPTD